MSNATTGIDAKFRAMMFAETKEDRLNGLEQLRAEYERKRDEMQMLMDACDSLIHETQKTSNGNSTAN